MFAVDLSGQVRQITQTRGCEYQPAWSPDGRWIAYIATKRDITTIDSIAEDTHVWVTSASGDSRRELTVELDRRARSPRWSNDSSTIFFLAGDHGYTTAFAVKRGGGVSERLTLFRLDDGLGAAFVNHPNSRADERNVAFPFQITSFSVAQKTISTDNGARTTFPFALTISTPVRAPEVWFGIADGGELYRVSAHSDGFNRSTRFVEPEEISFRSFDGTLIQGWLMKPVGFRDDRRYPLILTIHGGPHGMFGWGFNPTVQAYAARGYAVLYINPRGSSGYGQKFSDGTLNEWGGGDYRDLMTGVDEVVRRCSWIDDDRMGVTGGSYGGFMTNWIITQTPRFKAAVAIASVSNLISFYSTSLYQDLIHAEFGGYPWDNYELLWQWSPLKYVRQVSTPTMFLHGEQDNDVHITQAEEMYMALKRRGVESVLVRYPREGHGFREPRHRLDALERTLAWFDRFLK
jgi:dipeptidyl aminopeptidase/acylaminoacyl peptidase